MPAKPPVANKAKRRKRNKSSPANPRTNKKHKTFTDSDSEGSVYFEIDNSDSDSDSQNSIKQHTPPTVSSSVKMATMFSKNDLRELGIAIVSEIKGDIIKELKQQFKTIVEEETKDLRQTIKSLKNENEALSDLLSSTRLELDELGQYGRRMCLDISGISGDTRDPSEDVEAKFLDHVKKFHLDLTSQDIDRCHRKGKQKHGVDRKVIVKFTNSEARERVYRARKTLGAGIYVQENLTIFREEISYEARQLVRAKLLSKTWVAGCKVYGTMPKQTQSFIIKDMKAIQSIKECRRPVEKPIVEPK